MTGYLAVLYGLCALMALFNLASWVHDHLRGVHWDRTHARWVPHVEQVDAGLRFEVLLMTPRGLLLRSERLALYRDDATAAELVEAYRSASRRAATLNDPRLRQEPWL